MLVRRFRLVFVAGLLVGLLVACAPSFTSGSALTATPSGSGAALSWSTATVATEGRTIAEYRVDLDGVEIARIPGTSLACRLHGLGSGPHTVTVTAYDSGGEWSGSRATGGSLTAEVTAPTPVSGTVDPLDPDATPGCFASLAGTYGGTGERFWCVSQINLPLPPYCDEVHEFGFTPTFQLSGQCDGIGPCGLITQDETFIWSEPIAVCGQPNGSGYLFSYFSNPANALLRFQMTANGGGSNATYRGRASAGGFIDPITFREYVEVSSGARTGPATATATCS